MAVAPWRSREGRLGILFAAVAFWEVLVMYTMRVPGEYSSQLSNATAVGGVLFAAGLGLMLQVRIVRYVGALACTALALAAVWSEIQTFRDLASAVSDDPFFEYTPDILLGLASGITFAVMVIWLCVVMTWSLVTSRALAPRFTVRLVAATWIAIAVVHILGCVRILHQFRGFGPDDHVSALELAFGFSSLPIGRIDVSTDGIRLVGFMGWPIWHAAVGLVCLGVLVLPSRFWPKLATALLVLFLGLVALAVAWAHSAMMDDRALTLTAGGASGILAYLAWWYRAEIRELVPAPAR